MSFEPGYIQKVACDDEVDAQIITCLIDKGPWGILPSAIASELAGYGLKRWDVTCRIQCMNKKLMTELGQKVAEKHGHKWALTEFTHEAYDKSKQERSRKEEDT